MNLTLSVDDEVVEKARAVARAQGTSLNAMIRKYLESLGGDRDPEALVRKLEKAWKESPGNSGGERWSREDAYADRLKQK